MINVKITMVDGSVYTVRNVANSIKDFFKKVIAPYGHTIGFLEIVPGELINSGNIISMREMTDEELNPTEELEDPAIVAETPIIEDNEVVRPQDVPEEKIEESE